VGIFTTYLLMAALAPETMGERVLGVTFGFLFSLVQVVMTWLVTWLYLRKADRVFEPFEQKAAQAPAEPPAFEEPVAAR
jgi:uncharacterized membrane protein (DUF485 family)